MKKYIKSSARKIIPHSIYKKLHNWKQSRQWHREWDKSIDFLNKKQQSKDIRSIIIFPSDPRAITGSLGDDAMITAVVEHFQSNHSQIRIAIFCIPGEAENIISAKGFKPIKLPGIKNYAEKIREVIDGENFDALIAIGADIMDGYYNPSYTKQLLVAADLASRLGIKSTILGFSFNKNPESELISCYKRISRDVIFNVRDPISLRRFKSFAPVTTRLVSDSAFNLKPGKINTEISSWISEEKNSGQKIIGVNMHPMLIKNAGATQIKNMIDQMAKSLGIVDSKHKISWILIPHDYRDASNDGDGICLHPLMEKLKNNSKIRIKYFEGKHKASTIKALTGNLDGIITGRMHLAIASLGMGVPALCLTYQDKFSGLFDHFNIPEKHLLSTKIFDDNQTLAAAISEFISEIPTLSSKIKQELPRIQELAKINYFL